ncbi:MAG: SUMF1/EgtB/PvdO family nonheme iron enzyme [Thermoguttaceae bacterium]
MSEKFDPYHQWLGIPAAEQPPHHHRLLGISPFEADPTVIQNAAARQMAHLRSFQTGKQAAESQKLLNEVAAAKICLLNPSKRLAYDEALRAAPDQSGRETGSSVDEPLELSFLTAPTEPRAAAAKTGPAQRARRTPGRRKGPSLVGIIVSGLAAVLLVFGIDALIGRRPGEERENAASDQQDNSREYAAERQAPAARGSAKTVSTAPPSIAARKRDTATDVPDAPREVDLLKLVDPARDAVEWDWRREGDKLVCDSSARIEIPYEPPEEYDYRIAFVSVPAKQGNAQICRGGDRQFVFVVGGQGNEVSGFALINGQPTYSTSNPTGVRADHWLVPGQRHVCKVSVRKNRVEGWFDDKLIARHETDWSDMSLDDGYKLRRPNSIGIDAFSGISVESATVVEITGKGRTLGPAPAAAPPTADPSSRPDSNVADAGSPRNDSSESDGAKAPENPPAAKKSYPPSADEQTPIVARIDEVYKPGEAKDHAAKAALALTLLEDGRKEEANRDEKFVMFRRAGEIACEAGEVGLVMEAVDAISGDFDVQPFPLKARLLVRLLEKYPPNNASQVSTAYETLVQFTYDAAISGAIDEASAVADAAKRALGKGLLEARSDERLANAQALRSRTPSEAVARAKKVAEAKAGQEAIRAAMSDLAECKKSIDQARRDHDAFAKAEAQLKTEPDDPQACLQAGRWYCFYQGGWDAGLKLLAKGSDNSLKVVAAEDLGSRPTTTEARIARGDAWWKLADKAVGIPRLAMRSRAGVWYQEARPDLAPGLGRTIVEKRLIGISEQRAINGRLAIAPPLAIAPFDEKTAKAHQARWAKFLHVQPVQTNSIGMKLVLIPPGEFTMGSPKEYTEKEFNEHKSHDPFYITHLASETPEHAVRITKPYWLGVTYVTQEEYEQVMGRNPSAFTEKQLAASAFNPALTDVQIKRRLEAQPKVVGKDTKGFPVEGLTWDDAVEFCRRLSERPAEKAAHRQYCLPTEAQWEYASRAGTTTHWFYGDDPAQSAEFTWSNRAEQIHAVGQKRPNPWGLYDVYGSEDVWQWCQDWYEKAYYAKSPKDDPLGPHIGSVRVLRGGGWGSWIGPDPKS